MVYCFKNNAISTKLTFFMAEQRRQGKKIINDPVYGFIQIPDSIHFDVIEHAWFQRLRRIKQLGLTYLVYPGALHARFQHSVGAMHLMQQALAVLRSKGHAISTDEARAASLAILLHDIGHGPFSHTLEKTIVKNLSHEQLTALMMDDLNGQFDGALSEAVSVFNGTHPRKFLCQLVSSQLDMDRMDYLKRDSFFTGVAEGTINADRLLTMMDLVNDQLVMEAKGIYSVEKFLAARQLMYWQVYLHKTVLSAEFMLMKCLDRARVLSHNGRHLPATPALQWFLQHEPTVDDFYHGSEALSQYTQLDDFDVFTSLKLWQNDADKLLSLLSAGIVNRKLFRVELSKVPFTDDHIQSIKWLMMRDLGLTSEEAEALFIQETTSNHAYHPHLPGILILMKDGSLMDVAAASDQLNLSVLTKPVVKHFICFPKSIRI